MTSWLCPFGPGFFRALGENSKRYFRSFSARWRLKRVDGFNTIAERINRPWRMRSAHKPATMRSETRRFGERFRGRFSQELLFEENGLGNNRACAAGTGEAKDSDKSDGEKAQPDRA